MEASVETAVELAGPGIAGDQQICSANGPTVVAQMASANAVTAIGYDPTRRRFVQTTLKVTPGGQKPVVRIWTDKGAFVVASEQTVMLDDGNLVPALSLVPGDRLRACMTRESALVEGEGDAFKFTGGNLLELVSAECAVANWYPVPAVEPLGSAEVCELETVPSGKADEPALNTALVWISTPAGGVGIVVGIG